MEHHNEFVYILKYAHTTVNFEELGILSEKKLGKASGITPAKRVKGLNSNSPFGLELVKAWRITNGETALQIEGKLHRIFSDIRLKPYIGDSSEFFADPDDTLVDRVTKIMAEFGLGEVWDENDNVTSTVPDAEWVRRIGVSYQALRDELISRGYKTHITGGYVAFQREGLPYSNGLCIGKGGKMNLWNPKDVEFDNGDFVIAQDRDNKENSCASLTPHKLWKGIELPVVEVMDVVKVVESHYEAHTA